MAGKFLVASPSLNDSCFTRSVIYMCAHDQMGAMGVIINYPIENVKICDVMDQLNIKPLSGSNLPVYFGGPTENNRGFIIHSDDFMAAGAVCHNDGVVVTSNAEVLQAIANEQGPRNALLALGYAGWSPRQLEAEIESGSWIIVSATKQLLFNTDSDMKWELAIASLGFDIGHLSSTVGHA